VSRADEDGRKFRIGLESLTALAANGEGSVVEIQEGVFVRLEALHNDTMLLSLLKDPAGDVWDLKWVLRPEPTASKQQDTVAHG
jgi:hypothetical protein